MTKFWNIELIHFSDLHQKDGFEISNLKYNGFEKKRTK